ncbi:hypothetical protein FS749_006786, partial [Ceratobasidium sp. UAMH 11750]
VNLPFKLDDETLALLGDRDDFAATLEGLWSGEPRQSFSRSGAPSPELPPSDPVAEAGELNAAQEVAAPGGEQVGHEENDQEGVQEGAQEEVQPQPQEETPKRRRLAGKVAGRLARARAGKTPA